MLSLQYLKVHALLILKTVEPVVLANLQARKPGRASL